MKAIGYRQALPIAADEALIALDLAEPQPGPRDLLVRVHAVSVNPVDTKVRTGVAPPDGEARVLGFDAAGVVEAVGAEVSLFKPGDPVFYAGSIARPGTNGELHVVDERIVGPKPTSLSFAEAAALPLTAITAWELLFERLAVPRDGGGTLLIVGGAGGVGSMLIQVARKLTGLTVVATASRPETRDWCLGLGAHHVIDHSRPLAEQVSALGVGPITHIAALTGTGSHWPALADLVAPQGRIGIIDDPKSVDVGLLKRKSASLHWEFMFTRPVFETADMAEQGRLLTEVASLVDQGVLRTTLAEHYGPITAANLRRAHAAVEGGRTIGKIVLEGF